MEENAYFLKGEQLQRQRRRKVRLIPNRPAEEDYLSCGGVEFDLNRRRREGKRSFPRKFFAYFLSRKEVPPAGGFLLLQADCQVKCNGL